MSQLQGILGCDRVGQGGEEFFHDRGFFGRDKASHDRARTTGLCT